MLGKFLVKAAVIETIFSAAKMIAWEMEQKLKALMAPGQRTKGKKTNVGAQEMKAKPAKQRKGGKRVGNRKRKGKR